LAGHDLLAVVLLFELFVGVLMVMAVYEEERRRVERNMLALSNLNLATSSFSGGEIQKMLAQALDRVLNVVRIPAGALCLHYGEENGPTSVVVTGLGDTFCATIRENNLDDYIVNLVARLGGLVVLRDLGDGLEVGSFGERRSVPARTKTAPRTKPAYRRGNQSASKRARLRSVAPRNTG